MPLLAPVLDAARKRGESIRKALQPAQLAAWHSILLSQWWLPLQEQGTANGRANGTAGRRLHVGVDGTSHSIELSSGAHFILAAAAAAGPEPVCQRTAADLEVIPGRYELSDAATARDLMMQVLEAMVAGEAAGAIHEAGHSETAIVWLDGSLHSSLVHLAGSPGPLFEERSLEGEGRRTRWDRNADRALHLLRARASLLSHAERSGLWVVSVAKTQRASFLFDALATTPGGLTRGADERAADGELLAAMPVGWSWPVVLDGRRIAGAAALPPAAREALAACPAMISFYVRPHAADLPLRVDMPAFLAGLPDRWLPGPGSEDQRETGPWLPDPELVRPVLEAVLHSYGGIHAYNAPLFAVDRLVRLSRREVETRYLPICARAIGVDPRLLAVDRGRRRFLLA